MNMTKEQANKIKIAEVVLHGIKKTINPIIGGDCALFLQGLKKDFDAVDILVKNPSKIGMPYELTGAIAAIDTSTKYIYDINGVKFVFYEPNNINEIQTVKVDGLNVCIPNYILEEKRIEQENMGIKEKMNIDNVIDLKLGILKDILEKTLNVKVIDYCHGENFKNYLNFWVQCEDIYSMNIIARAINKNYLASENIWFASLNTNDEKTYPQFSINIHMIKKPIDDKTILQDIDKIILNIKYWTDKKYDVYFDKKQINNIENPRLSEFKEKLSELINNYSIENDSDTPDYIISDYIFNQLKVLKDTINKRDTFYNFNPWNKNNI